MSDPSDLSIAARLDELANDALRWDGEKDLVRDAARRLRRPTPKALGEAFVARHADGSFCTKPSGALDLFGHPVGARSEAGPLGTVVRVQVVEVLP